MEEDTHFKELLAEQAKTIARIRELTIRIHKLVLECIAFLEFTQGLEQQWQMQHLLETITDGIVAFDQEWRLIFVNQRGAEIFGQTPEALLGRYAWDIYPEAVQITFYREFHRAVADQLSVHFQEFYAPLNTWLEIHAYPSLEGLVVLYQDITVRKQTELQVQQTCDELQTQVEERTAALTRLNTELVVQTARQQQLENALKATNERLAQIFASITDGFCALNQQWQYIYINQKAEQLLEKNQSELMGRSIWEVFPESADSEFYQRCHEVRETGKAILYEGFSPFLNRWLQNNIYPSTDGIAIYLQDITERKQIEAERHQLLQQEQAARVRAELAEQRYAFLCEASAVLASSLSYDTTLVSVAQLTVPFLADFCLIHQLQEDGQLQQVAAVHQNPEKQPWVDELAKHCRTSVVSSHCLLAQVLQTGESQFIPEWSDAVAQSAVQDERLRELYRQLDPKSVIVLPLQAQEQILGTLLLAFADSNRHYNSADLTLATDLARRAAIAIDNAQLHQQALEADRLKDEFLMTLSHELRSPLNAILGWANILRRQRLDERVIQQAMETIERKAREQVQIIYDLLTTARIVTGKMQLNPVWVDLNSIVEAAIASLRVAIEVKSIQLELRLEASVGPLRGDPKYLQQIIWNLLSNAIKFTPDGGQIKIHLSRVANRAQIQISDTGHGIRSNFLPYVFDRFRQADGSTRRMQAGLGLGLALVRHLTELHGGTVQAQSQGEGQGATFTVLLPLPTEVSTTGLSLKTMTRAKELTETQLVLHGLQLLVVEPNPDLREMLLVILEGYGATVTAVSSAEEAVQVLNQFHPNLLISDVEIPNINVLMQQVKMLEVERERNIPALALTSRDREGMPSTALAPGFQQHVPKLLDPVELAAVIISLTELGK